MKAAKEPVRYFRHTGPAALVREPNLFTAARREVAERAVTERPRDAPPWT